MNVPRAPQIYVIAGANGAGKSSLGGANLRQGGLYFNPDELARNLMAENPGMAQSAANSEAWYAGLNQLRNAVAKRKDFAFETTLGGKTIFNELSCAASSGFELYVWFAGLSSPELHIQRVRSRAKRGGHDIPETDIRRRYDSSRQNLVDLMEKITELMVYDNSAESNPNDDREPNPVLVLHTLHGKIMNPGDMANSPEWAKSLVAKAIEISQAKKKRPKRRSR